MCNTPGWYRRPAPASNAAPGNTSNLVATGDMSLPYERATDATDDYKRTKQHGQFGAAEHKSQGPQQVQSSKTDQSKDRPPSENTFVPKDEGQQKYADTRRAQGYTPSNEMRDDLGS